MMKSFVSIALVLFCGTAVFADNLVKNGNFKTVVDGKAAPWTVSGSVDVSFSAAGAPEGGLVRISVPADAEKKSVAVCQNMTGVLRPGTRYKVSAKVRGTDFKAAQCSLLFINEGWTKSSGISKFSISGEWKTVEANVKTPDFKKSVSFIIFVKDASGVLEVADIKVEPAEEAAGTPAV